MHGETLKHTQNV